MALKRKGCGIQNMPAILCFLADICMEITSFAIDVNVLEVLLSVW